MQVSHLFRIRSMRGARVWYVGPTPNAEGGVAAAWDEALHPTDILPGLWDVTTESTWVRTRFAGGAVPGVFKGVVEGTRSPLSAPPVTSCMLRVPSKLVESARRGSSRKLVEARGSSRKLVEARGERAPDCVTSSNPSPPPSPRRR